MAEFLSMLAQAGVASVKLPAELKASGAEDRALKVGDRGLIQKIAINWQA
jgi:hypothetical protein